MLNTFTLNEHMCNAYIMQPVGVTSNQIISVTSIACNTIQLSSITCNTIQLTSCVELENK